VYDGNGTVLLSIPTVKRLVEKKLSPVWGQISTVFGMK